MAEDIVVQLHEQAQRTPLNEGRGTLVGAAYEIERLRAALKMWCAAAEAYERGAMRRGDQLVEEARRG